MNAFIITETYLLVPKKAKSTIIQNVKVKHKHTVKISTLKRTDLIKFTK